MILKDAGTTLPGRERRCSFRGKPATGGLLLSMRRGMLFRLKAAGLWSVAKEPADRVVSYSQAHACRALRDA
jgi:hypothetical protein